MDISGLIDKAMDESGCKSHSELAKKIGVSKSGLSQVRQGYGSLNDDMLITLADIAKVDRLTAVAIYRSGKAKSERARKFWEEIGSVAASLFLASFLATGILTDAGCHSPGRCGVRLMKSDYWNNNSSTRNSKNAIDNNDDLYIMRSLIIASMCFFVWGISFFSGSRKRNIILFKL